MTSVFSFLSKPIISLNDKCILGEIDGIFFDKKCKKAEYFRFFDGKCKRVVSKDDILHYSDALVVISTLVTAYEKDVDTTSLTFSPVGNSVYTPLGEDKGKVDDVVLDDKLRVFSFVVNDKEMPPEAFDSVGDILLLNVPEAPKHRLRKKAVAMPQNNVKVAILPLDNETAADNDNTSRSVIERVTADATKANEEPQDEEDDNDNVKVLASLAFTASPEKVVGDYDFLLNRVLTKPLETYSGVLIAPSGARITADIVHTACQSGKLVELTLHSRA